MNDNELTDEQLAWIEAWASDAIKEEATAPLLARIQVLEGENRVYADSVRRRRGASEVYIQNGEVVYR